MAEIGFLKLSQSMKILVTGNRGYIGCVLVPMLIERGYDIVGLDAFFYEESGLASIEFPPKQIKKDIRDINLNDFVDIDAVIHLAALSNDPLGELDISLTNDINFSATMNLARMAKRAGVRRFVYASSQSMYGVSDTDDELDEDNSLKNPLTVYAKTKWKAEQELKKLNGHNFVVVCFRPSTVFGVSPNLRCDIVFNNLVACAYTTGKIEIKSDGSPWRPVVHVEDISNAFLAGLEVPVNLVFGQSFNVGMLNGNFTVRDLAEAAQRAVPGSDLIFTGEHNKDSRTYKVSFKKILSVLRDYYKPEWDLDRGSKELVDFFKKINFTEAQFRGRTCNRLQQIKYLMDSSIIDPNLRWLNKTK